MPRLWGIIGCILLIQIAVVLGMVALVRNAGADWYGTYATVVLSVIASFTVCVLVGLAVAFSGGVSWLVGAQAERWTGELLQRLGPEWRFVHNIEFEVGDPPYTCHLDVDAGHLSSTPY